MNRKLLLHTTTPLSFDALRQHLAALFPIRYHQVGATHWFYHHASFRGVLLTVADNHLEVETPFLSGAGDYSLANTLLSVLYTLTQTKPVHQNREGVPLIQDSEVIERITADIRTLREKLNKYGQLTLDGPFGRYTIGELEEGILSRCKGHDYLDDHANLQDILKHSFREQFALLKTEKEKLKESQEPAKKKALPKTVKPTERRTTTASRQLTPRKQIVEKRRLTAEEELAAAYPFIRHFLATQHLRNRL